VGSKQSRLRAKLNKYGENKAYLPEAPERWEIRDGGKQVPDTVARRVFEEDREELKTFIHDMYHAYLSFALRRNYLNFSFSSCSRLFYCAKTTNSGRSWATNM